MIPTVTKIALLVNPTNLDTLEPERQDLQAAAGHLGMELVVLNARTESEIEGAFATAAQQGGCCTLGWF
jgi:putative ABC transport system substrate-binding protein